MAQAPPLARERDLYDLGAHLLAVGYPLPRLPLEDLAHVLRGMWDRRGFVGPNNRGYPVVSLVAPMPLAADIAAVIERVTGRRSPARPVGGSYWVGVSGGRCGVWLAYLYGNAGVACERKLAQARTLLETGR